MGLSPAYATDGTLFALAGYDVFRSTDYGDTWVNVDRGLSGHMVLALSLSPGFDIDDTLFVATLGGGVYRSADRGDSWEEVNAGLTTFDVLALGLSPAFDYDGTLFAGTDGGGVFRADDLPPATVPAPASGYRMIKWYLIGAVGVGAAGLLAAALVWQIVRRARPRGC